MKLFDTEYRIEIYNERTGNWNIHVSNFPSKDDAVAVLEGYRKHYVNSTYRLIELTISTKVLDI